MLGFTLCTALLSLASATVLVRLNSVSEKAATKHTLRVCNAYPSSHDLRLLKNNKELKGKSQMKYKQCIELESPLEEGDRLNFEAGSVPLGTFTVSDLPEAKSTLVLVAFRESKVNTKIAFMSHTFEAGSLAQLAVIDTFQGKTKADLSISQFQEPNKAGAALAVQEKEMSFNTAMELEAGVYQVKIATGATRQIAGPFVVANGENYVLLRTGLDDGPPTPPSFLQETQKSGTDTGGPWMVHEQKEPASLMAVHTQQRSRRDASTATSTGGFLMGDSTDMNLLAEHAGMQEQHSDTTGNSFFADSANVNLMAEHAGRQEVDAGKQHVDAWSTTGDKFFPDSDSEGSLALPAVEPVKDSSLAKVRLLASPAVEPVKENAVERGSGTSGPGVPIVIFPQTQEPPATGGLTEGAERGESLEQFLGLVSAPVYPQEFVVYPLLKPVSTKQIASEDKEQERSGASAVGPTAVMLAVAVLAALFA